MNTPFGLVELRERAPSAHAVRICEFYECAKHVVTGYRDLNVNTYTIEAVPSGLQLF